MTTKDAPIAISKLTRAEQMTVAVNALVKWTDDDDALLFAPGLPFGEREHQALMIVRRILDAIGE